MTDAAWQEDVPEHSAPAVSGSFTQDSVLATTLNQLQQAPQPGWAESANNHLEPVHRGAPYNSVTLRLLIALASLSVLLFVVGAVARFW